VYCARVATTTQHLLVHGVVWSSRRRSYDSVTMRQGNAQQTRNGLAMCSIEATRVERIAAGAAMRIPTIGAVGFTSTDT
jgi:hypothetical protein